MIQRKKVLVITYYWPPSGGAGVQRFLKFVKYFPKYGIDPVVLTCANPTYPMKDSSLINDVPAGLPVYYARTIEPFRFYSWMAGTTPEQVANPVTILGAKDLNLPQRLARWLRANLFVPDARVGWVPFAQSKARSLINRYAIDTVITTGPPHSAHFVGRRLKRKTGVRWIADFRDPWTDIHYNHVLPRTALTRKRDKRMETSVLNEADEVTVTTPGTARYLTGKVDRTYHIIPNGFDPDDFNAVKKSTPDTNRPLLIRHVGSITETSIPDNLLKAISDLTKPKVRLEFIGAVHSDIHRHINSFGLSEIVTIRSYVPHNEATSLMQQSDINVVVVHRSDDSRILIPGKLYDYLKAGKPILVIGPTDGDAAAIIRRCRIGAAFDYNDVSGPADWIRHIASQTFIEAPNTKKKPDYGTMPESECSPGSEVKPDSERDFEANLPFQSTLQRDMSQKFPTICPDIDKIAQYARPALTKRLARLLFNSGTEHILES